MHFIYLPASEHKPAQYLNLENVIKVIYGQNSESLTIKCVDSSMDTYTGERYQVLLAELNRLSHHQTTQIKRINSYVVK